MAHNTKNLKDLEYSIYALQNKASNINEQIKKYSQSLELKSEKKNKKFKSSNEDKKIYSNKFGSEYIKINTYSLEEKLENEVLELKKSQKKLIFILYVAILLILFFLITVIELKLFF
jgi:hypothetical protein